MIEYKFAPLEQKPANRICGYAAVYSNIDQGRDKILPGAFEDSIRAFQTKASSLKMLREHRPDKLLGVWDTVADSPKGLYVEGEPELDVSYAQDAMKLVKSGALDGISIGYRVQKTSFADDEQGTYRVIEKAQLVEASLVAFPMNEEARVTDVKQLQSPRQVEHILRNAGVPGAFAKLVAVHGFEGARDRLNGDWREAKAAQASGEVKDLIKEIESLKGILNG